MDEILFDGSSSSDRESVLLVDMGSGHNLATFQKQLSEHSREDTILQGMPDVLKEIQDLDEDMVCMGHDFLLRNPS